MRIARLKSVDLHWREDGDPDGIPVVFANSLGTDLRLWDKVIALLPSSGVRLIRFDKRGHGLSSCPKPPYSMEALCEDTEEFLQEIGVTGCIFVGLSIGGCIGQLLASRRPGLVKGLVLSNSAAKMGTAQMWEERIERIRAGGIDSMADAILERWFGETFRTSDEAVLWRNMLTRTPADGYIGCSAALAASDLTASTSGLALPVLGIGGEHDLASPSGVVKATTELVPGSRFVEIATAGHLPCVECPEIYAGHLMTFLKEDLHVGTV
ncbi:3-oxoadipate enol-lactonase [Roseibium sp. MMSF_3412]|uniref:3-oxoadipate enol-lactonase n=1 Tax=Roseibium sp. MMSF_3412 TaxID=3046712 RepID=UPI00273F7DC8|nr:3-oxoadipate enol-lactonase [Roseibium sp. MMSF_3412]